MAHIALVCPAAPGHALSIGTVGHALARRGHRVTLLGTDRAKGIAERLGLPLRVLPHEDVPMGVAPLTWLWSALAGQLAIMNWFAWHIHLILRHLPSALEDLAVDGVIVDHVLLAGGTAAERAGVPYVTFNSAVHWHEEPGVPPPFTGWRYDEGRAAHLRNRIASAGTWWFYRPLVRSLNRWRRAWGLSPHRDVLDVFSPLAQISQFCPELDFHRRHLPPVFHYVGSLSTGRELTSDAKFPWDRLDGRPLIYASLGTVAGKADLGVYRRILAACSGLDAQLVLALGRWRDDEVSPLDRLGKIPPNAIVVDFAPQLALLDRAAVLVTHAGTNSTLEALGRGVPIVALPRAVDQPAVAARVEYSRAGLVGSFRWSSPAEIRALVERVLGDEGFRRRARELQQAILAAGGADRAAEIAERALVTRRPVPSPFRRDEP